MNPNFFNQFVKPSPSRPSTRPRIGFQLRPRTFQPPRGFAPRRPFQPRGFPPRPFHPPRGMPPRQFQPRHVQTNHHQQKVLAPPFVPKPDVDAGLLKRIQHTAKYLSANPYFYETLRMREGRNPKFAFLFDMRDKYHPYFRWFEHAIKNHMDPDLNPYDLKNMTVGTMASRGRAHVDMMRENYVPMDPIAAIPSQKSPDQDYLDTRIKEFYDKIKSN